MAGLMICVASSRLLGGGGGIMYDNGTVSRRGFVPPAALPYGWLVSQARTWLTRKQRGASTVLSPHPRWWALFAVCFPRERVGSRLNRHTNEKS